MGESLRDPIASCPTPGHGGRHAHCCWAWLFGLKSQELLCRYLSGFPAQEARDWWKAEQVAQEEEVSALAAVVMDRWLPAAVVLACNLQPAVAA